MTESELLALDTYSRTLPLWGEWIRLRLYAGGREPIVEACSKITTPPGKPR